MPFNRAATARSGPWIVAAIIIAGIVAVYVTHSFALGSLIIFGGMAIGAFGASGSVGASAIFLLPAVISLVILVLSLFP
jgi:hypothetical protein